MLSSDEESIEVRPRKKRLQKMAYREAVQDVRSVNNKGGVNQNESSQDSEESHQIQKVITQLRHVVTQKARRCKFLSFPIHYVIAHRNHAFSP